MLFNPFNSHLRYLNKGFVSKESNGINGYEAETVGQKLVTKENVQINKKIKTLLLLTKGVQVGGQAIYMNPTILFLMLIVLIERG